jgi:hypothetical protein
VAEPLTALFLEREFLVEEPVVIDFLDLKPPTCQLIGPLRSKMLKESVHSSTGRCRMIEQSVVQIE